jgi:hypothetical protein
MKWYRLVGPHKNNDVADKSVNLFLNDMKNISSTLTIVTACAAIAWLCWNPGNVCQAQNSPPGLSPDLQEVVKLSQARMGDDVIKSYISGTGRAYQLSADDIIYLNSQGVSPGVISALQATASAAPPQVPAAPPQAPTAPPPPPIPSGVPGNVPPPDTGVAPDAGQPAPPPAPEVNFDYFNAQLAPFGSWVDVGGVMYWHPDQAIAANPDWRPYYDMGQWVQTDNGLFWQSDYTWGDIPFHYGRWILNPYRGWLWAPDYTWGPAWVFWRQAETDGAIGWAPLPVGAVFIDGGFFFNGIRVGLDFDFGLGEACFIFAGYDHFHEDFFRMRGREWGWHIDRARVHGFYGRSVIRNEFRRDAQGRFVNNGIGRSRLEQVTRGRLARSDFEERHPVGDRNQLAKERAAHPNLATTGHPGAAVPGHLNEANTCSRAGGNGFGNAGHETTGRLNEGNTGLHVGGNGGLGNSGKPGSGHLESSPSSSVNRVFRPPVSSTPSRPAGGAGLGGGNAGGGGKGGGTQPVKH